MLIYGRELWAPCKYPTEAFGTRSIFFWNNDFSWFIEWFLFGSMYR